MTDLLCGMGPNLKHPKKIIAFALGISVASFYFSDPQEEVAQRKPTLASGPVVSIEPSEQEKNLPSVKENPLPNVAQKPKLSAEERRKREEYFAKLDACEDLKENLVRPERENFKNKLNAAIADDIGDWLFSSEDLPKNIKPVGPIDKFYRAVAFSQTIGKTQTEKYQANYPEALKLIDEVIESDPKNSAGYLLKARILESLNRKEEAKSVVAQAEQKTDHYDTYMLNLKRKMLDVTAGAGDYLASYELENPLLYTSSKITLTIEKYKSVKLGQQIMRPASDPSKLVAEFEWSSWDYQVAKRSLERITGKEIPYDVATYKIKTELLAQQFPEFKAMEEEESQKRAADKYYFECGYEKMDEVIHLYKKALARSK